MTPCRVPLLAVATMVALIAAGYWLTRPPGDEAALPGVSDEAAVSVEQGKRLFWGRARCSLCHQVGSRGGIRRGPVLSAGDAGPAIGARAVARALERSQATGRPHTATDYLVESLLEPGAYLVPGYLNEMPATRRGPPPLAEEEIRAIVTYLQSLGGTVDYDAIRLPFTPAAESGPRNRPSPRGPS